MLPFWLTVLALPPAQDPFPRQAFLPWGGGSIDELHAGLVTYDLSLDLVLRKGSALWMVRDAGSVRDLSLAATGVVDSAPLRLGMLGEDRVAFTTDTGLSVLEALPGSAGTLQVVDLNVPSWAGRKLFGGPWGAQALLVGAGASDLAAALWNGDQLTPLCTIPETGTVYDVEPVDWDGDGLSEIAVLVDSRFDVYDQQGLLVATAPLGVPAGTLVVSRFPGARDVLVWEGDVNPSFSVLRAQNASGTAARTVLHRTAGTLVLDEDGDGDDDLVRMSANDPARRPGDGDVYERVGAGDDLASLSSFDDLFLPGGSFGDGVDCHLVLPSQSVRATAAGDFDDDGDLDFAIAWSESDGFDLRLDLGGRIDEVQRRLFWDSQPDPTDDGTTESVLLGFREPGDPTFYDQATHVELRVWTQSDPKGVNGKTPVTAPVYLPLIHAIPTQPPSATELFPASYPVPQPFQTTVRMYVVTQVVLDANEDELARGPSDVLYFAPSEAVEDAVLDALPLSCLIDDPTEGSGMVEGTGGGFTNPPPPQQQPAGGS